VGEEERCRGTERDPDRHRREDHAPIAAPDLRDRRGGRRGEQARAHGQARDDGKHPADDHGRRRGAPRERGDEEHRDDHRRRDATDTQLEQAKLLVLIRLTKPGRVVPGARRA